MKLAVIQEAHFARKKPLPEGYRQIVFICDAMEYAVILKNTPADWDIEIAVELAGAQKFCMATSPDKSEGWIERWRVGYMPRRMPISSEMVSLPITDVISALRESLEAGDPPLPPEPAPEKLDDCEVEIIKHDRGYNISFELIGISNRCEMRSLLREGWDFKSYCDKNGVYVLFRRPDGDCLLEAGMKFGRGGGIRRWHAWGENDLEATDGMLIRRLLKGRIYDAELFHRLDDEILKTKEAELEADESAELEADESAELEADESAELEAD